MGRPACQFEKMRQALEMAEQMTSDESNQAMLEIAHLYERLAEQTRKLEALRGAEKP